MKTLISITKALADPSRVRALAALKGGELCVCQLIEFLGLAPSTVSRHMSILRSAGLVENRKDQRWIYYRIPRKPETTTRVRETLEWVYRSLKQDRELGQDLKGLKNIRGTDKEALCRKHQKN